MSPTHLTSLPEGTRIDGYVLKGGIDYDGYAIEYQAVRTKDRRAVTVAEFLPRAIAQRAGDVIEPLFDECGNFDDVFDQTRDDFEADARALVTIRHPNVVRTLGTFRNAGTSYRVQARRRGTTLAEIIDAGGPLSQRELLEILDPMLDGLEAIHATGYVHGTITPRALLVRKNGAPLWQGFRRAAFAFRGLPELADSDALPELAPYEPIEALEAGEELAPSFDIFCAAGVLYRAATGKLPVGAADRLGAEAMVPVGSAVKGRYNETFLAAIDAGLAVEPGARPQSVAEWRPMFRRERRRIL